MSAFLPHRLLWAAFLGAATGCAGGPSPETRIDQLMVLAIDAPPEVFPGETVDAAHWVVEPDDQAWLHASWTCTRGPDGCAEEAFATESWPGLVLAEGQGNAVVSQPIAISPFLSEFVTDEPVPLVSVYSLACLPGVCPVLDTLHDGGFDEQVAADLANPFDWMADLSFANVALTVRTLSVSTRVPGERVSNPTITGCEAPSGAFSATTGQSLQVRCTFDGLPEERVSVFGYTTAGGWDGQEALNVDDGTFGYRWFAPKTPEDNIPLWLVLVDDDGGVAIWEGAADAVR